MKGTCEVKGQKIVDLHSLTVKPDKILSANPVRWKDSCYHDMIEIPSDLVCFDYLMEYYCLMCNDEQKYFYCQEAHGQCWSMVSNFICFLI